MEMEKEIFDTKELYGVFDSEGNFKVYYELIVDNTIYCLFDRYIPNNTIIMEEIKMFSPLVVYTKENYKKVLNVNWLDGIIFKKDDTYYKAIRFDKLLTNLSNIELDRISSKQISKYEEEINKKIEENNKKYHKLWNKITNSNKDITKKDKKIGKILKEKDNMINKSKIKRYVASTLLGATIIAGTGLAIKEATTDHTKELCPITKILNVINPKDSSPLGVVLHQIPAMQKDYKKQGFGDVAISYVTEEENRIETIYASPIGRRLENSTIEYIAPDGFEFYTTENGKVSCKKEILVPECHHYLEPELAYAKKLKID